jgi:Protein of unknown function (DUF1469).
MGDEQAFERPDRDLGTLVAEAIEQVKTLINSQIELAKIKMKQAFTKFAIAAGFFGIAILTALALFWWVFHSIELAFAVIVPPWAAALITSAILLLLVITFVALGAVFIKRGQEHLPDVNTAVQDDVETIKEGFINE